MLSRSHEMIVSSTVAADRQYLLDKIEAAENPATLSTKPHVSLDVTHGVSSVTVCGVEVVTATPAVNADPKPSGWSQFLQGVAVGMCVLGAFAYFGRK
jgi:hypothetical protein